MLSVIYSTVGSRDAALGIARTLVEERLAACANVIDGVTSVYRWNGAIQEDREAILLLKTRSELVPAAIHRVRELHPYDCPAIVAWEPTAVSPDYQRWVESETTPRCDKETNP